jgi:hypothetical protein
VRHSPRTASRWTCAATCPAGAAVPSDVLRVRATHHHAGVPARPGLRAALVPVEVVQAQSSFRAHVNGAVVQMTDTLLGHPSASDVTEDLRLAALDG